MRKLRIGTIVILWLLIHSSMKSQTQDCLEPFQAYDTTSINGNYLRYHVNNKYAILEYGNKSFHNFLKEKFSCDIADAHVPRFKWDNHDFICLSYGCGAPCWGVLILPLNSQDTIRNIMYDLAADPSQGLLVYLSKPDYDKIVVENIKTRECEVINDTIKCNGSFPAYCIDSISVKNNELYYRLAESNNMVRNKKLTEFRKNIK